MIEGLYIHLPFCKQICAYCDFPKLVGRRFHMESYVDALIREITFYQNDLTYLRTIHLGGGTPSHLPLDLLERLFKTLHHLIPMNRIEEMTIEVNPDDVSSEFVALILNYGFNRISIGVESSFDHRLKAMNRSHDFQSVINAVTLLHQANLYNLNLDFIFAWPNQTLEELEIDLQRAFSLQPAHLSFYSLIIEEKTKLDYDVRHQKIQPIDEEIDAIMYETILDRLPNAGYFQYEISNFAKKGFESLHNLIYWNVKEYLGIGMGAHSQVDKLRFHNQSTLSAYLKAVNETNRGWESDDLCDLFQETLLMGLRKTEGIHLPSLIEKFHQNPFDKYPRLTNNLNNHLIEISNDYLRCTRKGLLLLNVIERSLV